jgi:hypothetical protein
VPNQGIPYGGSSGPSRDTVEDQLKDLGDAMNALQRAFARASREILLGLNEINDQHLRRLEADRPTQRRVEESVTPKAGPPPPRASARGEAETEKVRKPLPLNTVDE